MSDEETRELARAAETSWDPEAWLRAGRAFVRAARWDEAGHAFARARAVGGATDEDLDAIGPAVDSIEVRAVHRFELPDARLDDVAWSRDGTKLFTTGSNLTEIDVATGATHVLAEGVRGALAIGEAHVLHATKFEDNHWQAARRHIASGEVVLAVHHESRFTQAVMSGPADEVLTYATPDVFATHLVTPRAVLLAIRLGMMPSFSVGEGARAVFLHKPRGGELELVFRDVATARGDSTSVPVAALEVALQPLETRLVAAGRRALLFGEKEVALVRPSGTVLGRLPWSPVDAEKLGSRTASPSGRWITAAAAAGARALAIADVITGERRVLSLDGHLTARTAPVAAWSPSGRRLALVTPRELVILGA